MLYGLVLVNKIWEWFVMKIDIVSNIVINLFYFLMKEDMR